MAWLENTRALETVLEYPKEGRDRSNDNSESKYTILGKGMFQKHNGSRNHGE